MLGKTLRTPAALDRPGLRWMLNGLSPAPIVVLVHRGRRSGRTYKTPVEAIVDATDRNEVVVSPMWGEDSDWYRNVLAGGLVEVRRDGEGRPMRWRQLSEDERREAIAVYRSEHPLYSRIVLRMLVRLHRLTGDPVEAVTREIPMIALSPPAKHP
jgi:deazaflavin-dependent oxidoreductase (nitroreductase family)